MRVAMTSWVVIDRDRDARASSIAGMRNVVAVVVVGNVVVVVVAGNVVVAVVVVACEVLAAVLCSTIEVRTGGHPAHTSAAMTT